MADHRGHMSSGQGPRATSGTSSRCPACGHDGAPGARFCAGCGAALDDRAAPSPDPVSGPTAPETTTAGERRRLTILFSDLVGSTPLSEQLDPEDLSDIVLRYQEMGRATVHRFGGQVAQYLGDGLNVHFGYPVAHEDDAARAVLAGLAILDGLERLNAEWATTVGVRLEARIGIHAGPTVVGAMGSADRADTSLFGVTPNVAARLEGFARPGTVLISDEVRLGLSTPIELVDRGFPELKGVSRPIQTWEVTRIADPTGRSVSVNPVPVIGRDAEQAAISALVAEAEAGSTRTVLLSGEPGIGKSRLVQCLFERLDGTPHLWLEGECAELNTASTLAPVVDLLRRSLDLDRADGTSEDWTRLVEAMRPLGDIAHSTLVYLADLLGVSPPEHLAAELDGDDSPELRRQRTLDALVDWTRVVARTRLVVVAIEDLHWSDPTTLTLLRRLTEPAAGSRLLCVFTTRPGPSFAWPDDAEVSEIELTRLPALEAERLTRLLAESAGLADELVDVVADRSDGIPLFIEELVGAAAEPGDADADLIPPTLHGVLAARLDRLGPARAVAQAASVLGREFPLQLLASIAPVGEDELGQRLADLEAAGVLTTRNTVHGVACLFRHALIQDAAYSSMLRRERRDLHDAAAGALASDLSASVERSPELLAHHLAGAGRRLDAADWYARAGRRAAERAALEEALAHLRSGLAVVEGHEPGPDRDERLLTLNILAGNVLMGSAGIGVDAVLPVWQDAIAAAERLGDDEELTSCLNGAAVFHAARGDADSATVLAQRILDVAERTGSRVAALRGNGTLGMVRFYQGDGQAARAHLGTAMSLARPGDFFTVTYGLGHDEETYFHTIASWDEWWLGWPDRSLEVARRGLRIALDIPSSLSQAMARHALATAHHLRGERDEAERLATENLALCTELGFPFWGGLARAIRGTQRARVGDPSGLDEVDAGLDQLSDSSNLGGSSFGMVLLAEANLGVDRPQDAVDFADLGLAVGNDLGQPFNESQLLCLKGRGLLALDRPDEARSVLEDSLTVADRMGARSAGLQAALGLAELVEADEPALAASVLDDALAAMGDGSSTIDQRAARDLLRRVCITR